MLTAALGRRSKWMVPKALRGVRLGGQMGEEGERVEGRGRACRGRRESW